VEPGRVEIESGAWRLLVLACSRRKHSQVDLVPAIDRYDGPPYRMVRRYLATHRSDVRTCIISAEYGIIGANDLVPMYDRQMTLERARQLEPSITASIVNLVSSRPPSRVLVCAGGRYLVAFDGAYKALERLCEVGTISRPPGAQLAVLHDWLYGTAPRSYMTNHEPPLDSDLPRKDELLARARAALTLRKGDDPANQFYGWYVELDGVRVGPKWLLSRGTGRPVSTFSTDTARRQLAKIGIEVLRV
jgi:hypothetical protein